MTEKRTRPQMRLVNSNGSSFVVSTKTGRRRIGGLAGGGTSGEPKLQPVEKFMAKLSDYSKLGPLDCEQHEPMLLARLRAEEKEYGTESPKLLETLRLLGFVFCLKGSYNRAEFYFRRGLEVIYDHSEPEMADRRQCLLWMISYVFVPQAKFYDALELAEDYASQGGGDEDIFIAFNNVCAIAYAENNVALAFECIRHALPFAKRFKDSQPESLAQDYHNAAGLALELGMLDEAMHYLKCALEIREEAMGAKNEVVIETKRIMAYLLRRLGRFEEALTKAHECHRLWLSAVGRCHRQTPAFTMLLAQIYADLAREEEADRFYDETICLEEELGGRFNLELIGTLQAYCEYCTRTRRASKAEAIEARLSELKLRYRMPD